MVLLFKSISRFIRSAVLRAGARLVGTSDAPQGSADHSQTPIRVDARRPAQKHSTAEQIKSMRGAYGLRAHAASPQSTAAVGLTPTRPARFLLESPAPRSPACLGVGIGQVKSSTVTLRGIVTDGGHDPMPAPGSGERRNRD